MMSPFLHVRLWWLRASEVQRASSTLAALLVVVLLGWMLVPTGESAEDTALATSGMQPGATTGGATPGAGTTDTLAGGGSPAADGAAPGSTPGGPTAGGAPAGGGAAVAGAGGDGGGGGTTPAGEAGPGGGAAAQGPTCPPVPDGTPGIDGDTARIAFAVLSLAGPIGNSVVGVDSPDDVKKLAEVVAADLNANGGSGCKQLELKFYEGNPISQDQQRSTCIQMAQDRPLLALDAGAFVYPQSAYSCLPQQKVPLLEINNILESEKKFFPYLASPAANATRSMRTLVTGLQSQGFFDPAKGFEKLGLLMDQCGPEVNDALVQALASIGIQGGKVSTYTFECPSGFAPPNQMLQAVTQFRSAGVTHVIPHTGGGSFKPFSEAAEGQRFRPKYGVGDYQGNNLTATSDQGPNRANFEGAISITNTTLGGPASGVAPTAATQRCSALAQKAGFPADRVATSPTLGAICSMLWIADAAMDNAAQLSREQVLPGLFRGGTIALSHPMHDVTFSAPDKVSGGDSWWPLRYERGCDCWKVIDPTRRPSP